MKYKKINLLLILLLTIFFIENLQIHKKIFILLTKDPEKRLVDQNGYCGGESVGFIKYLYKKYDFKFTPMIINFDKKVPDSYWSIFRFDKKARNNIFENNDYIILLNFNYQEMKLRVKDKNFNLKNYKIIENTKNCFLYKLS
tara:strand:- start:4741 stop:5166 length:426 start_codon:yes stop_codon:yes gene_type:complete